MKWFTLLSFVLIAAALGAALYFMLTGSKPSENEGETSKPSRGMARALALRVALSVGIFSFILLAWYFGLISPTGVPLRE